MCAGTSKDRERNEGMLDAGCNHIHHCIPRCCQGPMQAGAPCSRAHQIETLRERGVEGKKREEIKARNNEGFAIMVTLSGFSAADVSQTPHGPCSHPTATASYMNPDQSRPAHRDTHSYRKGEMEANE